MSLGKVGRTVAVKRRKVEVETVEKPRWEPQECPEPIDNLAKCGECWENIVAAERKRSALSSQWLFFGTGALGMPAARGSQVPNPTSKGCSLGGGGAHEAAACLQTQTAAWLPIALAGT